MVIWLLYSKWFEIDRHGEIQILVIYVYFYCIKDLYVVFVSVFCIFLFVVCVFFGCVEFLPESRTYYTVLFADFLVLNLFIFLRDTQRTKKHVRVFSTKST